MAALETLKRAFAGRKDARLVILVGSRARGDHRADSDVDVAVIGQVDQLALAAELTRATGRGVDVVTLTEAGYPLLAAVVRNGGRVHEGVRGAYGA